MKLTFPTNLISSILLLSIRIYQKLISPFFPPCCRFYPTCSNYSFLAIKRYGAVKGVSLTVKRVLRCNPYMRGGFDPVPLNL